MEENIDEAINRIKSGADLPSAPPAPVVPVFNILSTMEEKVKSIQKFIESYEYNYTGKPYFKMKKSGGSRHVQQVVKQLIKAALPIQCVEAVFLSCYVSKGLTELTRIPLSFKSKFGNGVHRHIVMAVHHAGKWGALGISRRECLMYKPMQFSSLFELVEEFRKSYLEVFHHLLTVYVGLPFPHNNFSCDSPITWRSLKLRMTSISREEVHIKLNRYCQEVLSSGSAAHNQINS